MDDLQGLPAEDRVRHGLEDLRCGRRSVESLWLSAAATRLRSLGLPIPSREHLAAEPELELYAMLRATEGDAYYRYNALLGELDSFVAGLEARVWRAGSMTGD